MTPYREMSVPQHFRVDATLLLRAYRMLRAVGSMPVGLWDEMNHVRAEVAELLGPNAERLAVCRDCRTTIVLLDEIRLPRDSFVCAACSVLSKGLT